MGTPHGSYCLEKTPFPSLSRAAATYNSDDINAENHHEATVTIDVTNVGVAGTLDVTVERKDPVSGKYVVIKTFAQIDAVSVVDDCIGCGCTTAKSIAKTLRVTAVVGVNAVIFSIGVVLKR